MTHWSKTAIPDLSGKIIIVTGASSGIGYETALALAEKGAHVILAVRNMEKGQRAVSAIYQAVPRASLSLLMLDLSDLSSIRTFAEQVNRQYDHLDILINNAGIMIPPLQFTKDGFESQFGCNHLGHFALTGLLLDRLKAALSSRVVTVSSLAAHHARIDFDNLDGKRGYKAIDFYGQSKLANMLFARELNQKLAADYCDTISVTCHPGFAQSNLFSRGSGGKANPLLRFLQNRVSQPASMGALPTLFAATEPGLKGGQYIGPDGPKKRKGYPKEDDIINEIYDEKVAAKLWQISEELTGVSYLS